MGRNVCRHSDGDAAGAVHKKVGNLSGKDGGFLKRVVEIGGEVNGILLEIAQHLFRNAR